MKQKTLVLLPLISLMLTSCGTIRKYDDHLTDYIFERNFHEKYNILQLSDIHWSGNTSTINSEKYLSKVLLETDRHIKEEIDASGKIDLVEITGDMFMLSNAYHVKTFIDFFEKKAKEYGFEYAVIWGNHDRHGVYNPNWLGGQFTKAKHCIYYEPDDDLYGRSNFVINLNNDNNTETIWQIANLDSGASFSETAISIFRDYDYIRKDQTDWWVKENILAGNPSTIAYYHIPQDENLKAWNNRNLYKNKYFKLEDFADNGNQKYESNFIDEGRRLGTLKAAFMGHAHNVDWTVDYDGVVIGLGVKTGQELYFAHIDVNDQNPEVQEGLISVGINENFDLIGASLVTIKDNNNFDLEHLYLNERTNEDFVRWVKW